MELEGRGKRTSAVSAMGDVNGTVDVHGTGEVNRRGDVYGTGEVNGMGGQEDE